MEYNLRATNPDWTQSEYFQTARNWTSLEDAQNYKAELLVELTEKLATGTWTITAYYWDTVQHIWKPAE